MKRTMKYIICAIVALMFIGTFVYLFKRSQPEAVVYQELEATVKTLNKSTIITGKVEPRDEVNVKPQINGIISELISRNIPSSTNFIIYWDADPQSELLNDTRVSKWNWETESTDVLMKGEGVVANNGSKSNPCVSADIFGDWREEIVWATEDNTELRIYMTDIPAINRMPTLMSDRMYRLAIAWQNVAYNQPPHVSFDMATRFKEIEKKNSKK